jgi:ubiquinone/menaquinone biosynthesis C-methylase UbiE
MKWFKNFSKALYGSLFEAHSLPALISRELDKGQKILDTGCGYSSTLKAVSNGSYRVGIDFYRPYIVKSRQSSIHNDYILGDVRALPLKDRSFDCAIAVEVLEHLDKDEGLKMLKEMERVASKIVLTTPNGFLPTYAGSNDNPDEKHLSGWSARELAGLGFRVYGVNGWKLLWEIREGRASLRRPGILFALLAGITELLIYRCPTLAFTLLCAKQETS